MPTLEEQIRKLTPQALQIFKRQLPQRMAELSDVDRNTALEQLRGMPELFETPTPPTTRQPTMPVEAPEEAPWWQTPLSWIRNIEVGAGTLLAAPFTPQVAGTEGLPWWERERAEYEAWEEPAFRDVEPLFRLPWTPEEIREKPWTIGVKGALEMTPWFATAIATGGLSALGGIGARTGIGALTRAAALGRTALRPALAVERALAYPITKPLSIAAKKVLPKVIDKSLRVITDLQPVDDAISIATQPTQLRNLVNVTIAGKQPLKGIAEIIGGRAATADNPATLGLLGRAILRFEGANKATAAIATLNRMGSSKRIFNLSDEGLMTIGKKQVHLNTIRTYPKKYDKFLNDQQRAWIEQAQILEGEKLALLERYGVEVPLLTFEEGGVYAGRRMFAKFTRDGELLDVAYIGAAQPGRPGAKMAAEKARIFGNIDDAVKEGYRYLPEEEALYYNVIGAYNRVEDKQFADWFLERVPWRTTAGPEDLKAQVNLFRAGVSGARSSLKNAHRQLKRSARDVERQQGITFRATEEVGDLLTEITTKQAVRQNVAYLKGRLMAEKKYANKLARTYANVANRNEVAYQKILDVEKRLTTRLEELAGVEPIWRDALAKARRAPFGGAVAPDIPAFAGKVFTSPEAKEYINIIRKELNPQFNSALHAINQVNAVGRYFALAGDISPFGIQLIFLFGADPKAYFGAMRGFVRSFFDPLYHDNLLAKNIGLLQRHPGLITTKGGATEMTELAAKGGLLSPGALVRMGEGKIKTAAAMPFRVMAKGLQPFMRGFEGALDTAGIKMAGSLDHLCTTSARTAQVDAFINEFRGLLNTTRLGISSGQRPIERALVLAPQYNRAIGALMWDVALGLVGKGGLRGQLARDAVAKGTAAIMAMTVAISYALGESEEEIIEHLNPMSTNFMTWDIAGQRVGPGSKVRSLLYTFGKMTKSPEDSAYHASRFIQGNFSPFVGTSMEIITGKNYMGDPTRDGLPSLTRTILGENLLPIWVQSVALEGGDFSGRVTRGMAEFAGMRGYPAGAYMELRDLQDELSQKQYGVSWEELGMRPDGMALQMRITRESTELQELNKTAAEESEKFARSEQLVWNEYGRRVDRIGNMVTQELRQASLQFEATGDGSQLRERVNQAYWLKAQMMKDLLEQEEFVIIKEQFETPLTEEQREGMQPQKLLYRDYNELMYAPDMFDEFGEYRFEEADIRRQMFVQRYGLEALNSVEMVIGERRVDEPAAVKMLRQAREILKPYWNIERQVWSRPEFAPYKQISDQIRIMERTDPRGAKMRLFQYPQIVMARKMIALYRKQLKMQNLDIANAVNTFYRY